MSCVLALVACLMLPAVHALHAPGQPSPMPAAHVHPVEEGSHGHRHGQQPGRSEHEPSTCDVCRVYSAVVGGSHAPPVAEGVGFQPGRCEVRAILEQDARVQHAARELPARGPPC